MTSIEILTIFAETVEEHRARKRQRLTSAEYSARDQARIMNRWRDGLDRLEDRWRRTRAPKWNPGKAPAVAFQRGYRG